MGGACIAQRKHFCCSLSGPRFDYRHSQKINFDVVDIYQRHWLEKSGQRLDNVVATKNKRQRSQAIYKRTVTLTLCTQKQKSTMS